MTPETDQPFENMGIIEMAKTLGEMVCQCKHFKDQHELRDNGCGSDGCCPPASYCYKCKEFCL
jgi:hypothetical protein